MGLTTDFNTTPYYDDFQVVGSDGLTPSEKYYRILFKPAVAVQARELTQLQSILQGQVERFGTNILKEGSVVSGGNFVEMNPLPYVKLLDTGSDVNLDAIAVDPSLYVGMKAIGSITGLEAIVVSSAAGLETDGTNLNTIYVRYINNALNGSNENINVFNTSEEITFYYLDSNSAWTEYQTVAAAGTVVGSAAVGNGYGVRCGEGVIYQKGHFVSFQDGIAIVSKYDTVPSGVVVGFETIESIVTSNQDTSLLDNASGFNNYNAPGADRLKLTPVLTVKTLAEAKADETFFSLQEYQSGRVIRRRLTTQFNSVEKFAERRTYDESGNYSVNEFPIRVEQSSANTDNLAISVGQGVAYVFGKRVELLNDLKIEIPESTANNTVTGQDIIANYGHYVVANTSGMNGVIPFNTFPEVDLYIDATLAGTAIVRDIERQADGNHRVYLIDVSMNSGYSFANVNTIDYNSSEAVFTLVDSTLYDYAFKKAIFPIGRSFIANLAADQSSYIYRALSDGAITVAGAGNTFNIALSTSGETFPYSVGALNSDQLRDIVVVASVTQSPYVAGEYVPVVSATVNSSTSMTVTIGSTVASDMAVAVYYNVLKTGSAFNTKTLKNVYIKIDAATNTAGTTGLYTLGMPDVYEIQGIWQGTSYSESETDVTDQFTLVNNQKDTYYGLSKIRSKKAHTIGPTDKILVKAKVFHQTGGTSYFAMNSYTDSIDDVSSVLPDDKIRTENIPAYTSESGSTYYLRDVLDFRPHAANTAAYSTTIGAATVDPADTLTFPAQEFVAPNQATEIEYKYYQGRIDRLVIDENGNFEVIQGLSSDNPTVPVEPTKAMSLATFQIPPYPSLPLSVANRVGKSDYGVSVTTFKNRRYTMNDIGKIDNRVKNLEYYTSLSLLETQAKDLLITDSAGNNRFKNGIMVDNFENLSVADLKSTEFAAGIDPAYKEGTPKFRTYPISLKVASTTSATDFGETITMTKTDVAVIDQPYATDVKSCTTDFYKYEGAMAIFPSYDTGPDTARAPDINFDIDLATPFAEFADALSEFVPLKSVKQEVVSQTSSRSGGLFGTGLFGSRTTTTVTKTTTKKLKVGEEVTSQDMGDFVTNVEFSPYMRSKLIEISISGIRPNTRFYFFFDGKDVNDHVAKGSVISATGKVLPASAFGNQVITSDSNGILYAVFRIPEGTFFVGDRSLEVFDVPLYSSKDAITSYASKVYSGFNFSVEKTGLAATTRMPVIDVRTKVSRTTQVTRSGGSDPIAQTFAIDSENSSDNSVMITKLDLYFASKSTVGNGVNIQIRETVNGYPGPTAVPFSEVHLTSDEVNVNAVNATSYTTVTFPAPVALKTDIEYCVVVAPDANDPDYRVWISRTGGIDVDLGQAVTQDTNAGVLFTSTNNKAWTPYQNENLKFVLYKAAFSTATGSVTLTHDDYEFLSISNISGQFIQSEKVFRESANLTGTVAVVSGNTTISGTSTLFNSELTVGEYLVYRPTTSTYQVLQIDTITSNTELTVIDIPFVSNNAANFYNSPVGDITFFTTGEPKMMVLEKSTAKADFYFAANNVIIGAESNSTATIDSVKDQEVSYAQVNIARSNFMTTRTDLSAPKLWNGTSTSAYDLEFNDNNYLIAEPIYIRSRSNEFAGTGANTFELKVNMSSTSTSTLDTSPMIDYQNSDITIYHYLVNNDNTDETTIEGDATSKYVSKKVVLADGLDADDIRVYLTGYRPPGSTLDVYVRFQNSSDSRPFDDIEWTRLAMKAETDFTSSIADRFDYKEFEYYLGNTAPSPAAGGGAYLNSDVLKYTSPDGAIYNSYKVFAIKVVMLAAGHNAVPRIKDMRVIAVS